MLSVSGMRSGGPSILTVEAADFSEISVYFIQTLRHHNFMYVID